MKVGRLIELLSNFDSDENVLLFDPFEDELFEVDGVYKEFTYDLEDLDRANPVGVVVVYGK